jgi:hypothetical protein
MCRVGVTGAGATGEIEKVSHVFQPDGRFAVEFAIAFQQISL